MFTTVFKCIVNYNKVLARYVHKINTDDNVINVSVGDMYCFEASLYKH
jgi:hypothetical protein